MMVPDIETPVVVLRLDHYGGLGIMRSLGRLGIAVYGVHRSADALAFQSRYSRAGFIWDIDEQPASASVDFLLTQASRVGGRPILLPSNDETALLVAKHADRLRAAFRFQDNSAELVQTLYDKRSMQRLAEEIGIPTAQTRYPTCREEVRAFAASAHFPLLLKGSDGIRVSRRTGEKMAIVRSPEELLARYDEMEDPARPDLMLQEYIPGGEDAQWMFNGYYDANSECRFGITGRKLRQTPVYTGMTSLGMCTRNDQIEALTNTFMKTIGYRGIIDIGYRYDARDGTYKVLDVNPRVGSTFRLFVGDDGMDVVRALYLDLTGQPVPPARPCEGRKWLVEDLDLASSVRYRRDGVLSARDWVRSFAGVRETAWFAADDPAPFLGMCRRFVAQASRKLGKVVGLAKTPLAPVVERPAAHGERVRRYFAASSSAWKRVYEQEQLGSLIYRERHATALRMMDGIPLSPDARVLEVGCGAGYTAVALARRGFSVAALDATPEMLSLTRQAAAAAGVTRLTTHLGEVQRLEFAESAFDLIVALGVLPWLDGDARGMAEMARVLKRGGHLIATADNQLALQRLLDPRATPILAPARAMAKWTLERCGARRAPAALTVRRHQPAAVDRLVRAAGLEKVESTSVGFGPFSLLGRKLLSDERNLELHHQLQRLAADHWPILRSAGAHYVILARKPSG